MQQPISISDIELAYIAGFFDGEGCIHYSFKKHWTDRPPNSLVWMQVSNTDQQVIDYLKGKFGGFIFRQDNRDGRRVLYNWKITGRQTFVILRLLLPYLRTKHDKAQLILQHEELICKPRQELTEMEKQILIALTTEVEWKPSGPLQKCPDCGANMNTFWLPFHATTQHGKTFKPQASK